MERWCGAKFPQDGRRHWQWPQACRDGGSPTLLLLVSRESRRQSKANEKNAANIALEFEIAAAALQPIACTAGGKRIAAIGHEAEQREEQTQKGDLRRHMSAVHLYELRQEGKKE
jgi:hypothetical protein